MVSCFPQDKSRPASRAPRALWGLARPCPHPHGSSHQATGAPSSCPHRATWSSSGHGTASLCLEHTSPQSLTLRPAPGPSPPRGLPEPGLQWHFLFFLPAPRPMPAHEDGDLLTRVTAWCRADTRRRAGCRSETGSPRGTRSLTRHNAPSGTILLRCAHWGQVAPGDSGD